MNIDFSNHVDELEDLLDIDYICERVSDTEHDVQKLVDENQQLRKTCSQLEADNAQLWDTLKQIMKVIEGMNQGQRFLFEHTEGVVTCKFAEAVAIDD